MRVDIAFVRKGFSAASAGSIRVHPFALDDAGIAAARLLGPVPQSDRQSAPAAHGWQ